MKNVLVIDDIKANRIFITKCLEDEGYNVTTASNGKQALELLKTRNLNLIILDMKMPGMSGMQILKWIKQNSITTPVIIVTAYGTVKNAIECMNNGVIEYIQKPFSMDRFRKCISDVEKKIQHKDNFESNITETIFDNLREANSETQYAPAERMPDDIILTQVEQIVRQNNVINLFNMMPYSIIILNHERQIVYSNNYFLQLLGIKSDKEAMGFRPGEILKCIHANEKISGCGTTECCSVCGAVKAILESQKNKVPVSKECLMTLTRENCTVSIELLIYAAPAEIINNDYTILVIKDISDEKRRQAIEAIFLHDILNSSGAIKGVVDCMEKSSMLWKRQKMK